MIETVYRKFGLTSCMLLAFSFGIQSFTAIPVYAQTNPLSGLLNSTTFAQDPSSLLTAPGGVSNNTLNLLTGGGNPGNAVPSDALATALKNSPGSPASLQNSPLGQISGLLDTIKSGVSGGGMSPTAATGLISNLTNGMDPSALQSLAQLPNLGNMTGNAGDIQSLFNNPAVQNLLNGKPPAQQASLIDSILNMGVQGGGGAVPPSGQQALAQNIQSAMPGLADALKQLGPLGDILQSALGSGLAALLGGGSSSTSTTATSGTGQTGSQDNGDYRVKSLDTDYKKTNYCGGCGQVGDIIAADYQQVRQTIKDEFIKHRNWIVNDFWKENVLPAMMLMAEQLSVIGIQQVEMFGTLLDAKHQMETERLFQQMTAQAHKDYHPSEGMCTFGTTVRSLAASERKSNLVQVALAGRMMQRQTMDGDVMSFEGPDTDIKSRLSKFTTTYCDKADDANGLEKLCQNVNSKPERRNIDVDYTRNVESKLTLDIDMTQKDDSTTDTADKEDLFALAANLYSHNLTEKFVPEKLGNTNKEIRQDGAEKYLDMRAVYAKRSVAQNSFAAITAMRASGDNGSAPYTKALIKELGISDQDEIEKILGKNPSYFAQMEILTKKIYQNPTFYTELYDKPVNVERKGAAIEAISLMQDRDLYNSLLRSEAVLSVLLETMLDKEQDKVVNAMGKLNPGKEAPSSSGSGG